jgi:hypothetical protein
VGYVKELQVTGSGLHAEWQIDEKLAATTPSIAQLWIDITFMSGGESAKSLPVDEEQTSLW